MCSKLSALESVTEDSQHKVNSSQDRQPRGSTELQGEAKMASTIPKIVKTEGTMRRNNLVGMDLPILWFAHLILLNENDDDDDSDDDEHTQC